MTNLGALGATAICGFTNGLPLGDRPLIQKILEYGQPLGLTVAFTPIDQAIRQEGVMREGFNSLRYGLPGDPVASETIALTTLLELSASFHTPVHIMRVSTNRGVALIRAAKEQGLPITASTTWLHLLLTTDDIVSYDPNLKLAPPLGNKSDREALIDGIKTGVIDAIAIDHQAYTYEENTVAFASAPPGAIGLELALPLLWQNLVTEETWSPLQLWQALTANPLACLGQTLEPITVNSKQDLILFNPHQDWIATPGHFHSPAMNTSWLGKQIRGKVLRYFKAA
jgi:dihydroorotase